MADVAASDGSSSTSEGEGAESEREGGESEWGRSASIMEQQGHGSEAGTRGIHARQIVEHVACNDVGIVEY
jgi:hypothetical protein